jgi:DNA segregation ATPase FtsK/SpoIIIE-like protein
LASIEANDGDTDLMFAEEASLDAAAETAVVTPILSVVKTPTDSMEMAEPFQAELSFDAEPPILYKSEPQEAVATEPEAEAEMEAEATEVETEPAAEFKGEEVAEVEPVPDEVVAEDPAAESPSRPMPAAGQPPRTGGDDWASWMTEEAPTERTQGIAKPSYPQSAAFAPGSLSTVEPEGMEGYHGAVAVVLERDQCSVSLLQRELGISFAAAAAAVEQMEKDRIVGPYQGSGHREVLLTAEAWRARLR